MLVSACSAARRAILLVPGGARNSRCEGVRQSDHQDNSQRRCDERQPAPPEPAEPTYDPRTAMLVAPAPFRTERGRADFRADNDRCAARTMHQFPDAPPQPPLKTHPEVVDCSRATVKPPKRLRGAVVAGVRG